MLDATPRLISHRVRRMRRPRASLGVFIACIVVASGRGTTTAGTIRADRDPQLYIDLAADPAYAGVGLVQVSGLSASPALGSGTLVGSQWVLTAAHVVEDARALTFTLGGINYAAADWALHPGYDGDVSRGYDLALVRLSESVPSVQPAQAYRGHAEQHAVGVFAGFGLTGTGASGSVDGPPALRAGTNVIDGSVHRNRFGQATYASKLPRGARTFAVDFDNPGHPADNVVGSSIPTNLEYLIAPGDSGGPAFISTPDGPRIAGVHSYALIPDRRDDSDYGDVTVDTRVSAFAKWIDLMIGNPAAYNARKIAATGPYPFPLPFSDGPPSGAGDVILALPAGATQSPGVVPLAPAGVSGAAILAAIVGGTLLQKRRRREVDPSER